ncbi:MAG: type III-A CRISPR-associated RAMP protein Csm3 [Candidatus Thioglobus sp.]|nr:type III-A CRISPR-associated RAMP protein Csm3 [Candidatus Thioglobus sp.]
MNEATNTPQKLAAKIFVNGIIQAETGLHIGGNSVGMAIGGADTVVVRNPLTNVPYIPGSSLRGKMRSLMERTRGMEGKEGKGGFSITRGEDNKGNPTLTVLAGKEPKTDLGKFFGTSAETGGSVTRLTVRDCPLTPQSQEELENAPNTDMPLTEVKTEVVIDRITSAASPRQIERVPAGAKFEFCFAIDLLGDETAEQWLKLLAEGMRLVQDDSLGGSGSRGYGQVKFGKITVSERTAENYKNGADAKEFESDLFKNFAEFSDA